MAIFCIIMLIMRKQDFFWKIRKCYYPTFIKTWLRAKNQKKVMMGNMITFCYRHTDTHTFSESNSPSPKLRIVIFWNISEFEYFEAKNENFQKKVKKRLFNDKSAHIWRAGAPILRNILPQVKCYLYYKEEGKTMLYIKRMMMMVGWMDGWVRGAQAGCFLLVGHLSLP